MIDLEVTKVFKKDLKKIDFSNKHYAKYIVYIGMLLRGETLPKEAKDHQLKGSFSDYREFHVSGDLLVIYKIENNTLYLARIGSHSELFK